MQEHLTCKLGFLPRAIAVMGKWEPTLSAEQCLREVSARAAGALAIAEMLAAGGSCPFLLSAEGHLLGQPRPGCQMAAEIMIRLGADPSRIRCWAAANRTTNEVRALDRMRHSLGGGGLLLVTSHYHAPRARHILRRTLPGAGQMRVVSFSDPLVHLALLQLPHQRREVLARAMALGQRRGLGLLPVVVSESVAYLSRFVPGLERWAADTFRGKVEPAGCEMFTPLRPA